MNSKRRQVLSAVRGQMRHMGVDPTSQSFAAALCVLEDFTRTGHAAGQWYASASDNQLQLLRRDWTRWQLDNKKTAVFTTRE